MQGASILGTGGGKQATRCSASTLAIYQNFAIPLHNKPVHNYYPTATATPNNDLLTGHTASCSLCPEQDTPSAVQRHRPSTEKRLHDGSRWSNRMPGQPTLHPFSHRISCNPPYPVPCPRVKRHYPRLRHANHILFRHTVTLLSRTTPTSGGLRSIITATTSTC